MNTWFDDIPVLGKMSREQAIVKLRQVEEIEVATALERAQVLPTMSMQEKSSQVFEGGLFGLGLFQDVPYLHTGYVFGYLDGDATTDNLLPFTSASRVKPDLSLKESCLKITLDHFYAATYPGRGRHHVLLHFFVQNQIKRVNREVEDIHSNTAIYVQNGEKAAIHSHPLFIGLNVGNEGLVLKCYTINVKNDQDQQFLDILGSDVFKTGLKLASTVQPVITPFSEMALGIARMIAKRNSNIPVQNFELGLDFSSIRIRAHLALGSYIIVQVPPDDQRRWRWDEWAYNIENNLVVYKTDPEQRIPYNYLILSFSCYEE